MKPLSDNPKNEYFRDMYAWRKAHHICTKCGQEDAAKGRTRCINCLEKCRGQIRKPLTTEQRYAKHIRQKRRYDLLTAFGVCTKCNKHNALPGKTWCLECTLKRKKTMENKRRKAGIFPRDSYSDMCFLCGKNPPLDGKKLCGECYKKSLLNLAKANAVNAQSRNKHIWRGTTAGRYETNGGTANEI